MQLVIDGYNLIFAVRSVQEETDRPFDPNVEREKLLDQLVQYHARTGLKIHVVFDGARTGYSRTQTTTDRGIQVSHSPKGETADEVIMDLLRESHHPKAILLVTGDREIRRVAEHRHAPHVDSQSFAQEMLKTIHRKRLSEPRQKYTGVSHAEADCWMKLMGFTDDPDDPNRT